MKPKSDSPPPDSIEGTLDSLLAEEKNGKTEDPEKSAFGDLKAVLLAVDWEISEDILVALDQQLNRLQEIHRSDPVIYMFLQLLTSITRYIRLRKADTHPDAIKLLNSVFNSLEIVSFSKTMTNDERKKVLTGEVKKFKKLKDQLSAGIQKAKPAVEPQQDTVRQQDGETQKIVFAVKSAIEQMMPEIRKIIQEEIRSALKSAK